MRTAEEKKHASDRLLYAAHGLPAGIEREAKIAEFAAELKDLGWNPSDICSVVNGVRWILKPPAAAE